MRCLQFISELDERSLRLVLGYLPAWVKFSEFERARSALTTALKTVTCVSPELLMMPKVAQAGNIHFDLDMRWLAEGVFD